MSKKQEEVKHTRLTGGGIAMSIGETLHTMRFRSKLTEGELAVRCGVSSAVIELIEKDKYDLVTLDDYIKAFGAFGYGVHIQLLDRNNFMAAQKQLADQLEKLPNEEDEKK